MCVCVCKSDTTCPFGCTVVNLCTGSLLANGLSESGSAFLLSCT